MRYKKADNSSLFFFFNDPATTEIYTLSLHDALPIYEHWTSGRRIRRLGEDDPLLRVDRKSTRLNSSHGSISYAVFCFKKNNSSKEHTSELKSRQHLVCRTQHSTTSQIT